MTRKDIEKAAVDSCVFENSIFNPALTPYYEQGFKDGASWRINSVWNDKSNMPSYNINRNGCGELCLVETVNGNVEFTQACYESDNDVYFFRSYSGIIELYNVKRWAYIKDLIPNTEMR